MAEKYGWRKNTQQDEEKQTGGQQTSEKEYGWRKSSSSDVSTTVGTNITDRVNTWLKNHDTYISNYQNRNAGRKYDYSDSYVRDSASWLDTVSKQKSAFDAEADSILSYMDQYKGYLDEEWMQSVRDTLSSARGQQSIVLENSTKDNEWWGSFKDETEYQTAQRYDGYSKKYSGQKYDDIQKAFAMLEDGEEKNWLATNQYDLYKNDTKYNSKATSGYKTFEAQKIVDQERAAQESMPKWQDAVMAGLTYYDSTIGQVADMYKRDTSWREPSDEWDESERKHFGYLYAENPDKAYKYAEQLNNYYNSKEKYDQQQAIGNWASQNAGTGILGTLGAIASAPMGVADFVNDIVEYGARGTITQGSVLTPFEAGQAAQSGIANKLNGVDPVTGKASRVIDENVPIFGGKGWGDVYSLGVSAANSLVSAYTLGGVGTLVNFIGQGGAAGVDDALSRGASAEQALLYGAIVGAAEGLTEMIPAEKLVKVGSSATLKNFLKKALKQGVGEFVEEGVSSIIGNVADNLIMGSKSNFYAMVKEIMNANPGMTEEDAKSKAWDKMAQDAVFDAIGGFATGATNAMTVGGVSTALDARKGNQKNIDALNQHGGNTDALIQKGLQSDQKSESYQLAKKYQQQVNGKDGKQGKAMTGFQIRNLLAANQAEVTSSDLKKIQNAAANRLAKVGQREDINKIAELATKYATGQEMTRAERSTLARSNFGSQVASELLDGIHPDKLLSKWENDMSEESGADYSTEWTEEIGTESVNALSYNKKAIRDGIRSIMEQMASLGENGPNAYKPLESRMEPDEPAKVSTTGKAVIRGTEKAIDLSNPNIKEITKDGVVLDVDGELVNSNDIDYANEDQWYAMKAISKIENITPAAASAMIAKLDMTKPVGAQLNGMDEAFTYGFHNYSEADLKAGNFVGNLSQEQLNDAYKLGQYVAKGIGQKAVESYKQMRTAADAAAEKAAAEGKAAPKSNMTITYNHGGGVIEDIGTAFENLNEYLNDEQLAGIEVANILRQMGIGTSYEFFRSYNSKTLTDEDGNPLEVFLNDQGQEEAAYAGVYMANGGKIRINLNAYSGTRGLALNALSHELTHFIKDWSLEKYESMAELLVKSYGEKGVSMHKLVLKEQSRLENIRHEEVSYDEAYDEVVANAFNRMLEDGKVMERIAEIRQVDKSLADKIIECIRNFIKRFTAAYRKNKSLFHETEALMEMKEVFEQLQEMFAEALVDASDNFQAAQIVKEAMGENAKVETNARGELLFAANESGNVLMYSEQTYLNGGRDKLKMALRQNGHTAAEIEQTLSYVDDALDYIKILAAGYAKNMGYTNLSDHLIADIVTNVKTGKQVMSAIVNNGDYPVNIDLSLICKKRVAYMNLMSRLIRDGVFDKVNYDGGAIAEVNEILRNNGFETACLGCFVESRRLQFQTWAETIVSEWNSEVEKRNPNAGDFGFAKGKMDELTDDTIAALTRELESVKKNDQGNVNLGQGNSVTRMGRLLDALPSLQKKLTVEDLLTPEGLTALRKHDGSLFSIVKSRYGAASPKIVQDFNPYASEIAMLTFAQVKGITNNAVKGAQAYVTEVKNEYGKVKKANGESKADFDKRKKDHEQKIQDEAMRRYLYDIGGARIQSFSDFMIENVFDYIQIFADLAAKRLPLHGYTKEIVCMRLFGMTGAKWNGSLIAHVERSMGKEYAGLLPSGTKDGIRVKVDGKDYVIGFDDYARNAATGGKSFIQSIGMKDVIALQLDPRYSPYVGNITIGVSDAQILAMLDNPLFRMVIPYHASGMLPMFAKLVGVDMYNDYTDYQNTTVRQYYDLDGKAVSELKNAKGEAVKADTSYAFNAEVQKTKDAKIAANNYLKWCAQRHPVYDGSKLVGYATFNPKFSSSPYGTDFTRHENYYKLLEDFNTYDCITEASTVQGAVTMNFPSEENRLTDQQMAAYKQALRDTGIFTEKDIEKYAKKASMTFKEIIDAEVGNRANYAKAQNPKWESTVKEVEAKLQENHAREMRSSQQTDNITNRHLLANAFEGISQNSNEYKLIQRYKGYVAELNSLEDKLSEFRHEIRKLRFGKDEERDAQKLARLESEAKKIAEAINKHDKEILSLEASEPLRKVIEHERKKESEKTRAHVKEIQQNKKVRAEQAELRHKIRKTIRDLDKILKHGNKQKNVKEDLQPVVTKALKAADILFTDSYSTYDMLRNGLGVDLSDSEEALVKSCTKMLKDIDKMATDGYDNWQARQEAESKLSAKMSKLKDVFARERKRLNNTTVSSILGELADAYKSLEESEQSYVKGAYMEPVYEFLKNLQSEVGGAIVQDMTKAQLESVYAAYKMVLTTVRKANELFNKGIKMNREQLGNAVINEVMAAGGTHGLWTKGEIARSRASWNNMKPIWVANRIGSESFGKLMQGLFEGQYNFAVDIDEAKRFKLDMDKKYKPRSWDKDKLYEFESSTGKEFSLNLQQIMSLYAFSKREQAYSHLLSGGFVYEANSTVVVDKNGIKRTYLHDGATSYKLNEATLNEIIGTLTAEQKAYVDEMQAYLSDVMGAKGNEVSMKLYGIQLFKEKFYFPLRSSGAYMERAKEAEMKKQQGQINLVNSGFTHAVKPQAKNPIILSGFMDVWAEHCNEMSMYHSMVLPMEDFRKVYNYSTVHDESYDSASVYQSIQDAYGKAATDYIDQLYRELNAGATVDPRETPFKAFISKFKKASVMMSASVVVQQFSSVGRAYALIDPKYFIGAKVDSETKLSTADEMKKYAPVAIIKEMGGFDTGTKGSAKNYILAEVYGKGERLKGLKTDEQYRSDLMGFMPAKADEITWCAIWEAVKREIKAKHSKMDVKSEEFLKLAGERFSEVIEKTQVYDSVLARSANMRSKSAFMNMATAFMAEPTTTINLLEDALRGRSTKKIARVFGAVAVSIVLNNALASVVYAMRDDDEDETFIEKYFQSFTSGMIDDINPMSYYPFLKDVYSLFQGYDVERADMSVIADLRDALKKAVSVMGKDTDSMNDEQLAEHYKSVNEILLNLLDAGCSAFGVPMKNVRRDANGIINAYTTISKDVTERDTSWNSFWDKVGSAAKDTIPIYAWTKDTAKADKLYDAIISGDKEYLARMKSGYKDESAYHSAVRKALRENDPRIQEAANAKYNGNINEYKRIFKEIQNEGKFSFDDIMSAINTELSKLSPDKATSEYTASGYVEAVALGNMSNAKVMKDDIIATKMANGMTEAEAEKAFASDVATGIKNAYSAGLLTEARAEEMLVDYAGKGEGDAASKVSYWAFIEKNPKYKDVLTESNVEVFHEFAEPAGISLDVYAQFVTGTKGLTTIYDDWGDELKSKREQVLEVIDSLPLTWQQKDALYLAAGYSENKIMDVPW